MRGLNKLNTSDPSMSEMYTVNQEKSLCFQCPFCVWKLAFSLYTH